MWISEERPVRVRRNCNAKACVRQEAKGTRRLAARTAHSRRETGKSTGTEKGSRSNSRSKRPTRRKDIVHSAMRMATTKGNVRKTKSRSEAGRLAKVCSGIRRKPGLRLGGTTSRLARNLLASAASPNIPWRGARNNRRAELCSIDATRRLGLRRFRVRSSQTKIFLTGMETRVTLGFPS